MAQESEAVGMVWLRKDTGSGASNNLAHDAFQRLQMAWSSFSCLKSLFICSLQIQWSRVYRMHLTSGVLAILVLLSRAGNTVSPFHDGYNRQSRLPRAPPLQQQEEQRNFTTLPSLIKYAPYSSWTQISPLIHTLGQQACAAPFQILSRMVSFAPQLSLS